MFTVILKSKDRHDFQYTSDAKTKDEAIEEATIALDGLGWSYHGYTLKKVKTKKVKTGDYK